MQTRPRIFSIVSVSTIALLTSLVSTSVPSIAAPLAASNDATYGAIQTLAREITFTWAKMHPLDATSLGLSDEDGKLETPSLAANARDLAAIEGWKRALTAIPLASATLVDRDDARLLHAELVQYERDLTQTKRFEKDPAAPGRDVTDAIFVQFQQLPIVGRDGATAADATLAWSKIVSRLVAAPAYIKAAEALVTHPGHLYGVVGSESLAGVPDFLGGALTAAAKTQVSPEMFAAFVAGRDATVAAISHEKREIDAHVASWPENYVMGRGAYDAMLRDEQLLPFTSVDVERMAHDELAHGWAVQTWVEDRALAAKTPIGPLSGGGLAPGGPALINYYRDRIAQLTSFVATQKVVDVPAWLGSVDVVETPKFQQPTSPGASMRSPLLFSKNSTGYYFITPPASLEDAAKRLDANEDFDRDRILSTGAHEAMPGHFMQGSIARRHPDFVRKTQESGVFAEGWAFYGEELFVQLGLYGDNLDARYYTAQWERVRGARAIVDPELASGAMSYDTAVDFFEKQTGFTHAASKAAVAGIALYPGYVISYTVGRYQLQALLAEYRERMGASGTLHDFHTRLLSYGTTPFAIVAPELLADLGRPLAEVRASANY